MPNPIPRDLALTPATIRALSEADAALGVLDGLGHLIREPQLLLAPYLTQEALASSRIEGTEASLSDVLVAEASATGQSEGVEEVERYLAATRKGLELIETLPLTQRLIKQTHEALLSGVRGEDKLPGEFRRSPVWVGSPTASPDNALYVPPLAEHLPDLLTDWERFVNEPSEQPALVRCALMHYQFETIHPFLDGNGRIGRLLIGLMLIREERLHLPLLYLSGYLETHRREYYDRLQAVRERGEVQEWLQFFLTAVKHQSLDAVSRARALVELREHYLSQSAGARSQVGTLVGMLFGNPFMTVNRVEKTLSMSNQGARRLVKQAEALGWIREVNSIGQGGATLWASEEILEIIQSPLTYGS